MTVNFSYPFNIQKDTPAVAVEVQTNFDALRTWILNEYRQKDDTPQLTVMPTLPGAPTIDQHAATKAYVDLSVPVGVMFEYGGTAAPSGFLLCDGATYSTTQYPALFAAIGRSFTPADVPSSSFLVPDRRGRVGVGRNGSDLDFDVVGKTGGQKTHVLVVPEMPLHTHTQNQHTHTQSQHSHTTNNHSHTINHGHSHTFGTGTTGSSHEHGRGLEGGSPIGFVVQTMGTGTGAVLTTGSTTSRRNATTVGNTGSLLSTHTHNITGSVTNHSGSSGSTNPTTNNTTATNQNATATNQNTGGGLAHPNLQPYLTLNYIIRAA